MSALWGYFAHLHKGGSYTYIYRCQQINLDPVHTCPYIFENRDFVLLSKRSVFESFFAGPHESAKTMEIR